MRRVNISVIAFFLAASVLCAAPTKKPNTKDKTPQVATNFEKGAELKPSEVEEILKLSRQCGVSNVVEVSTFHFIPVGGIGIAVKSKDRIDGRDRYHDILEIGRIGRKGWEGPPQSAGKLKRVGGFSANPTDKYTVHEHDVKIPGGEIRIRLGEGIGGRFADVVIPRIISKDVQFDQKDGWNRSEFERFKVLRPESLSVDPMRGQYRLRLSEPAMHILMFKWEKGKVIVTAVVKYNI